MALTTEITSGNIQTRFFATFPIHALISDVFFYKPNRKYCEDYKDFDSELRQNLGPQLGSTLAGLPIKAELYALA